MSGAKYARSMNTTGLNPYTSDWCLELYLRGIFAASAGGFAYGMYETASNPDPKQDFQSITSTIAWYTWCSAAGVAVLPVSGPFILGGGIVKAYRTAKETCTKTQNQTP